MDDVSDATLISTAKMNIAEAFELVLKEGNDIHGMVVETRGGNDPGRDRVQRLISALEIVREAIQTDAKIDRELACALYGLAFHMGNSIQMWKHCEWMDDFVEMATVIQYIFDGV